VKKVDWVERSELLELLGLLKRLGRLDK